MTRIEDYALIGDCHGAGLVSRSGSLDWLCVPQFDSNACFAALLGTPDNGRWQLAPSTDVIETRRRYCGNTLSLETQFKTAEGVVSLIDCMPTDSEAVEVVRLIRGLKGEVPMKMDLCIRFDFGRIVPWVTREHGVLRAIAGADMLHLYTDVEMRGEDLRTRAEFSVSEGEMVPFALSYQKSTNREPTPRDPHRVVSASEAWWADWANRSSYRGPYQEAVMRSLITLKALTYAPTGGLVAAPTTSLPEALGLGRNWDYRYCWLRDATTTLFALLETGYVTEAERWREWLLRAIAGDAGQMQILYGIDGTRRLEEIELPWLPGYEGSQPVRQGNAAYRQFQLDVYGELLSTMHECRLRGLENDRSWALETRLLEHLEGNWKEPDEGIWEVRAERQHFTHSKVMAWLAFDRGIAAIQRFKRDGPLERWQRIRDAIHNEVCQCGYNSRIGAFTQYYGSEELDASLLMMAPVGFLPVADERIASTVNAIQRELGTDGLIRRYHPANPTDGIGEQEGHFIACSFWLVDNLALLGRIQESRDLFERLLSLRNDVGLLAEEYDVENERMLGNFPQALSHLALINSACSLWQPAKSRAGSPAPRSV